MFLRLGGRMFPPWYAPPLFLRPREEARQALVLS